MPAPIVKAPTTIAGSFGNDQKKAIEQMLKRLLNAIAMTHLTDDIEGMDCDKTLL